MRVLLFGIFLAVFTTQAVAENPFKKLAAKFRKNPELSDISGNWAGEVAIPGSDAFPIYLSLSSNEAGSWDYPSVGCSGTLKSDGEDEDAISYQLRVGQGSCKTGSKLLLSPHDDGQLQLEWFDAEGNIGITAVLARVQSGAIKPPPTASNSGIPSADPSAASVNQMLLQPQGEMRYEAQVTKNANLRDGPTTENAVIAVVPQGSPVAIAPIEGNWYQTHAIVDGQAVTGWVYKSLIETDMVEFAATQAEVDAPIEASEAGQLELTYAGYSEHFADIRTMYSAGELQKISDTYDEQEAEIREKFEKEKKLNKKIGLLRWLERGVLNIDQGNFDDALKEFTISEELIEKKEGESRVGGFFKKAAFQTAQTLTGQEELGAYSASGWEKVLMLNYKTITYLLLGDRKAYNVTRRAIDWQNIEKREFDAALARENEKAEKEFAKEKAKQEKKLAKHKAKAEKNQVEGEEPVETPEQAASAEDVLREALAGVFKPLDKKADSVPSAYVNPFGFYVAGMVQEFESYSDRSLQDNARISYSKALELNPQSKVLQEAVTDMETESRPGNVNLVHVIVADGFVPEKKVLTYQWVTRNYGVIPFKLQIYDPVGSQVERIEVQSKSGTLLATLSTVSDVEALCLRQQKDTRRLQVIEALTSTMTSAVIEEVGQGQEGISGSFIRLAGKVRQDTSAPDMRSWLSLPATVQAARLRLEKGVSELKIVSFDKSGKKLATQSVNINPDSHGVVYVRSINNVMFSHVTNQLWM